MNNPSVNPPQCVQDALAPHAELQTYPWELLLQVQAANHRVLRFLDLFPDMHFTFSRTEAHNLDVALTSEISRRAHNYHEHTQPRL